MMTKLIADHTCTLAGACHDANGAGGMFKMAGTDWEKHLVGVMPAGGGNSMCGAVGMPYITKTQPAGGLILNKLKNKNPACGDQMPSLPPTLTATEIQCVQDWANKLVADTP